MRVLGIGQVSACGAGREALEVALGDKAAAPEPSWKTDDAQPGAPPYPVMVAPFAGLERFVNPRQLRRIDAFSQRMALAAHLAVEDAGGKDALGGPEDLERTGIIVATGYGALGVTFAFLDDVIDKRDALAPPIAFAGSVHNAPASNISSMLGIRGPTVTVTAFSHAWQEALMLARSWLEERRVARVLVVAGDEFHRVLASWTRQRMDLAVDGKMRPLELELGSFVPGETFAALLLARDDEGAGRRLAPLTEGEEPFDVPGPLFVALRGIRAEAAHYRAALEGAPLVEARSALWGGSPTSDAMTTLSALVSLGAGQATMARCLSCDARGRRAFTIVSR